MHKTDPDLPEEFHEIDRQKCEKDALNLLTLGIALSDKRAQAIKQRKETGIEAAWMACEEAYLCIDEQNRHEYAKAKWAKPTSMQGPVTNNQSPRDVMRSTAYVRLTARYVDMAAAMVGEIMLPIDDKAFTLEPTPIPDLVAALDDNAPATSQAAGAAMMPQPDQAMAGQPQPQQTPAPQGQAMQQPGMPPQQQPAPAPTATDIAKQQMAQAKKAAEKEEQQIYDWMIEANYPGEMRKVIHDAARIGVGVLKAPFPALREGYAFSMDGDEATLEIESRTVPGLKWIDPWNIFPFDACGEKLSDAGGIFERDSISARQLEELKKLMDSLGSPIYIAENIDKVLKEGPEKCNMDEAKNPHDSKKQDETSFTIWYYTGTMKREDLAVSRAVGIDEISEEIEQVSAVFTMVNDTVIRATPNPLVSGRHGYHNIPWSRRAGSWAGVGVAEQVSMPQRMLNASTRALLNNAGFSAGSQIIIKRSSIVPADQNWTLAPNKIWYDTGEDPGDITKTFTIVNFPNITSELQSIIQLAYKMAEEASNIPLVTQGQQGPSSPDTFGAAELQNSNAKTLLRSTAYSFDDHITDPVVHLFHEWYLLDPEVKREDKGDWRINARGSISMVERAIQEYTWMNLLQVSLNPSYGLSPGDVAAEYMKSKRIDPRKAQLSDEDKAKQAQAQPMPPPVVMAAQIREQGATQRMQMKLQADQGQGGQPVDTSLQIAQIRASTEMNRVELNQRSDMAELNFKAQEAERQRAFDWKMKQADLQMKMMEFAERRNLQLEDVKAQLAKTTMQLSTQKELSAAAIAAGKAKEPNPSPQVASPPVEPVGRAEDGQAFAQ